MNGNRFKRILKDIEKFQMIEGWLSAAEAAELYLLTSSLTNNADINVCEIGTWKGKSAYVFAQALRDHDGARIYCVDPFNGDGDTVSKEIYCENANLEVPLIEQFRKNLRMFDYEEKVRILQGYSWEVVKTFDNEIDLLFIDGNHDYPSVLRDYFDWYPLIKRRGYIVFHDVTAPHTIGPKRVVEENIFGNPEWKESKLVDSLLWARKS